MIVFDRPSSLTIVPLAIASSAACYTLYRAACAVRSKELRGRTAHDDTRGIARTPPQLAPGAGAVSHVHLRASNLDASVRFYRSLGMTGAAGLEREGAADAAAGAEAGRYALLRCPGPHPSRFAAPYLLLEHDPSRVRREAHAADAGIGRVCLLVKDAASEAERMAGLGYRLVARPVLDRPGTDGKLADGTGLDPVVISALEDPDGNIIELVSFSGFTVTSCAIGLARSVGLVRYPAWVHFNVNATSYQRSLVAYQEIGFTVTAQDYGRVVNKLYKSMGIPDPGVAGHEALIRTPKSQFCLDLIEWEDPRTKPLPTEMDVPPVAVAMAVADVTFEMERLTGEDNSWTLSATPLQVVHLPAPLGPALVGTIQDPDGVAVELVSYPRPLLGNESVVGEGKSGKKVVFITGCDSGFGRSFASLAASLGFRVVAVCYTEAGASFLRSVAAVTVVADLTTENGLCRSIEAAAQVAKAEGGLWAVVNNAGTCQPGHVAWLPPSKHEEVMRLNYHAPVSIIHGLLPLLRQDGGGRIINVTSVCGLVAAPSNSAYSASKFALEALSDSLRVETKPFGIDVVVVQPTTMKTPLAMRWADDWLKNFFEADPDRTKPYSKRSAEKYTQSMKEALVTAAEDPMITVADMLHALAGKDPPTRILSGVGAKNYHELSLMPDCVRDDIFQSMTVLKPDDEE